MLGQVTDAICAEFSLAATSTISSGTGFDLGLFVPHKDG
jgi:hypothetical protein